MYIFHNNLSLTSLKGDM